MTSVFGYLRAKKLYRPYYDNKCLVLSCLEYCDYKQNQTQSYRGRFSPQRLRYKKCEGRLAITYGNDIINKTPISNLSLC